MIFRAFHRTVFFFFLGITLLGGSCTPLESLTIPPAFLSSSSELEQSRSFQRAIASDLKKGRLEQVRIDYLLELVWKSPYNFIRNGSRYTGKRACIHLRWKYFKNRRQIKTAEEFINQIATSSKMSGEMYEVVLPDNRRYPLRVLLVPELNAFDEALEKKRELVAETAKET